MDKVIVPVVPGSNVSGNIGSCSVQVTEGKFDYWQKTSIYTNSCTGEVVKQSIYPDQDVVNGWVGGVVFLLFIAVFIGYVLRS